jgi:hypothetical protein
VWLAEWASNESLPPSQRKRAQEERDRRKALNPEVHVGLIIGEHGATPEQQDTVGSLLHELEPDFFHFPLLGTNAGSRIGKKYRAEKHGRQTGMELVGYRTHESGWIQELVKSSTVLIVLIRGNSPVGSEDVAIKYARHRKVPVKTIKPTGEEE